jgi:hypothetical protein
VNYRFAVFFSQHNRDVTGALYFVNLRAKLLGIVGCLGVDFECAASMKADVAVKFRAHTYSGLMGMGNFSVFVWGPLNLYSDQAL